MMHIELPETHRIFEIVVCYHYLDALTHASQSAHGLDDYDPTEETPEPESDVGLHGLYASARADLALDAAAKLEGFESARQWCRQLQDCGDRLVSISAVERNSYQLGEDEWDRLRVLPE